MHKINLKSLAPQLHFYLCILIITFVIICGKEESHRITHQVTSAK